MKKANCGTAQPENRQESDGLLEADPWVWWRKRMPVTKKWAYFDHAAVGPLSGPAADAIRQFAEEASDDGDMNWPSWASTAERLRRQFSKILQADPTEICLVPNTTSGVNLVAEGFPWEKGDNVVIPEGEFPSNLFPWQNQRMKGVELRMVPRVDRQVRVEDLIDQVDEKTRLIAVSWVGYASGFRIDLDRLVSLAHEKGVLVFLDAIQGLGVYPLDLQKTPVDFLAADGHKWLLGPEGIGVAMVRRKHLNRLRCTQVGWNSVKNSFNYARPEFELRDAVSRFEGGSANLLGVAALSASLDLFLSVREVHGENAIENRILSLTEILEARLGDLGIKTRLVNAPMHRSGIVTFEIPGVDPAVFRKFAIRNHVVLSCRDGGIRASVHAYNNGDDIERLAELVHKSLP